MNRTAPFATRSFQPLLYWALFHLVVWSLIPFFCNTCLPLDTIEASMWGSEWAWGYDKHPPLSGWTAHAAALLAGDLGIYFLAQLCVVTAGIGIYRLARLLTLSTKEAFLAVLSLDLLFYYQYAAVEFNVNILQMPFWAWGWFFGLNALQNKRYASWLGLGACIAMGALTKYIAVFMLVPLFAAWWTRGELKTALKSPGLYLAATVSMLLFLPHLIWMINHEWITITYGLSRGGEEPAVWWQHIWHPVEFIMGQAAIMAPALITAAVYYKTKTTAAKSIQGTGALFFGAFAFIALFSLISGMAPVTMWAAPMPLAIGIWLVSRFQIADRPRFFLTMAGATTALYAAAYILVFGLAPVIREKPHRVNYPGPEIARQVEEIWKKNSSETFDYIIADEWAGGIVNHYGHERPSVVIHGDYKLSPYLREEDVKARGALVFWQKSRNHLSEKQKSMQRELPGIESMFAQIIPLPDLVIPWPRRTDGRAGRYGVAYIPPENPNE